MLKSLTLSPVYDTLLDDITHELFSPLLQKSYRYHRAVGYFTSDWFSLHAEALSSFFENGGKIHYYVSPHLFKKDFEAMIVGEEAKKDSSKKRLLFLSFSDLSHLLKKQTSQALSYLIAYEFVFFHILIPQNGKGIMHDKLGLFSDIHQNKIIIHGSSNDTYAGSLVNLEGINVFHSWKEDEKKYFSSHFNRISSLINDHTTHYKRLTILQAKEGKHIHFLPETTTKKLPPYFENSPIFFPSFLTLREYQQKAVQHWMNEGNIGFFTMATGTGKTITSLACAAEFFKKNQRIALVISAPTTHLVTQWEKEAKLFGFSPILCRGSTSQWFHQAKKEIHRFNLHFSSNLCLITTHKTSANKESFLEVIDWIQEKEHLLLIADEAHGLGAPLYAQALSDFFSARIGLSATPKRWSDKIGTEILENYFQKEMIHFPIEQAIKEGYLVPYEYHPLFISLTEDEFKEYLQLTKRIIQLSVFGDENEEEIKKLLFLRAKKIKKAVNKYDAFYDQLQKDIETIGKDHFSHTIVYCADGEPKKIVERIRKTCGISAEIFDHTKSAKERTQVLRSFELGNTQLLVAMKCLDEGVDIPQTERAYFLASTTNPKEFIQRRGRVLRPSPQTNKEKAVLYDFFVLPPISSDHSSFTDQTKRKILERETARFLEFNRVSLNKHETKTKLLGILSKFNAIELLNLNVHSYYSSGGYEHD